VLESSAGLRVTGFAFTTWTNAWRALDAVGIGHSLRQQHGFLEGYITSRLTSCHHPISLVTLLASTPKIVFLLLEHVKSEIERPLI
jgi:hypothetical protein